MKTATIINHLSTYLSQTIAITRLKSHRIRPSGSVCVRLAFKRSVRYLHRWLRRDVWSAVRCIQIVLYLNLCEKASLGFVNKQGRSDNRWFKTERASFKCQFDLHNYLFGNTYMVIYSLNKVMLYSNVFILLVAK